MENQKKESYTEPVLTAHELLRDITAVKYRDCQKAIDSGCPE
ncbi:MAG: hypothetical protein NTNFB02_28940 [Nitrospira sp.]